MNEIWKATAESSTRVLALTNGAISRKRNARLVICVPWTKRFRGGLYWFPQRRKGAKKSRKEIRETDRRSTSLRSSLRLGVFAGTNLLLRKRRFSISHQYPHFISNLTKSLP
jgi:hypothetical protein